MALPVSGAFKRQTLFVDPLQTLHVADPDHLRPGHAEEAELSYTYDAPPAESVGYDVNETWASQEYIVDSSGGPLDSEPWEQNVGLISRVKFTDMGDLTDPGGSEKDLLRETLPQHARNTGGPAVSNKPTDKPLQFSFEQYGGARFEGLGPEASEVSETALRRGLNADEQNNPPDDSYLGRGFRYGWVEQAWVDRKLVGQGLNPRTHDLRVWEVNTAWIDQNTPPPKKGNPYTVPFSWLSRGVQILTQRPQLRRTPNADAIAEVPAEVNEQEPYAAMSGWVVG